MSKAATGTNITYTAREAVGVFGDAEVLDEAVTQLEKAGFDRAQISVLATDAAARARIDRFYHNVKQIEDSGKAPQAVYVNRDDRIEGEGVAIAVPLYIGGVAGAIAVVASGGALAFAIGAAILGGAVGGGLGAVLAGTIAEHHTDNVAAQLQKGGLVVWVSAPNPEREQRALEVLTKAGARDVHAHQIEREWHEMPYENVQPDPLLGRKP
ncbi:MAG: hypothetical protein ACREFD_01850 [Stellaceae bacterium]